MLGMATLLRGITISMVPLIGLGSDQVSKSRRPDHRVEAWHFDEFKGANFHRLRRRMQQYTPNEKSSIIIYISPQQLKCDSQWFPLLRNLAKQGYISSICIDEVHATVENSISFRPEFKDAIAAIKDILKVLSTHHPHIKIPILAMSTIFRTMEQRAFNKMMGQFPSLVEWGPMDKRGTGIFVQIAGEPGHALMNDWLFHTEHNEDTQSLLYSNSAKACDESLLARLDKARAKLPKDIQQTAEKLRKEFVPLTGACGIMLKTYIMEAFCGEGHEESTLPTLWCVPCTSAANCGVSSLGCTKCYRYGLPPNLYDLVQEMGRVNRLLDGVPGEHGYHVYLNVSTFLSLWIRAQRQTDAHVRERNEMQLHDVICFLVLPDGCYHDKIEKHFERPATYVRRGACDDQCSFCNGDYKDFCGRISKEHLIGALQANIFDRGAVRADKLVTFLTDKANTNKLKKSVWGETADVSAGQIHGVVLMLFASGLLELRLSDPKLAGRQSILAKDVMVFLSKYSETDVNGESYDKLKIHNPMAWPQLQFRTIVPSSTGPRQIRCDCLHNLPPNLSL